MSCLSNLSEQVLLQQGAKIEYKNDLGQAALSRAAGFGSERMVQVRFEILCTASDSFSLASD